MKGLLQSKIFRKNLKKWLCMYVGALLILTTVVTYSKYISKFNMDDNARVTKFDITIIPNDNTNCTGNIDIDLSCSSGVHRPTTEIPYNFVVNNNFEVNTILAITAKVNKDFDVMKFEEITSNGLIELQETIDYTKVLDKDSNTLMTITRNINASSFEEKSYRVTIKYKYDEKTYSEAVKAGIEAVSIDYSAKQIKN